MSFIDISGTRLETRHIEGPAQRAPLVFLHEGLGSVAMWTQRGRDWPSELCAATGRAGWVYSRRGYGRSDPIPDVRGTPGTAGPWSTGRHTPDYMHKEAWDVLPLLLTQIGARAPVLIGHSDGATIALLHASRHPTTACVAIAPHVLVEDMALQAIDQARQLYEQGVLRPRLAKYHADVDNAFWQWNDVWLSEAFRSFDIRDLCSSITTPLLLVQGVDDEYGSLQQLQWIQAAAPHAQQQVLAQCGHSPHRDQPEALTADIARFLADLA
jgi:pimeloyl-ACP methyl ester carboxylesterase